MITTTTPMTAMPSSFFTTAISTNSRPQHLPFLDCRNPVQLGDFAARVVLSLFWIPDPAQSLVEAEKSKMSFVSYSVHLIATMQLSSSCVLVALFYLRRLHAVRRHAPQSERWLFSTALVVATKYLEDSPYMCKTWADVLGLPNYIVTIRELDFLRALDYSLHINLHSFYGWAWQCQEAATTSVSSRRFIPASVQPVQPQLQPQLQLQLQPQPQQQSSLPLSRTLAIPLPAPNVVSCHCQPGTIGKKRKFADREEEADEEEGQAYLQQQEAQVRKRLCHLYPSNNSYIASTLAARYPPPPSVPLPHNEPIPTHVPTRVPSYPSKILRYSNSIAA